MLLVAHQVSHLSLNAQCAKHVAKNCQGKADDKLFLHLAQALPFLFESVGALVVHHEEGADQAKDQTPGDKGRRLDTVLAAAGQKECQPRADRGHQEHCGYLR